MTWNSIGTIQSQSNGGSNSSVQVFYAIAASPLNNAAITATSSNATNKLDLTVFGIWGANAVTPLDTNVSNPQQTSSTTTSISVNLSTTASICMLIGATVLPGAAGIITPGSEYSALLPQLADPCSTVEWAIVTSPVTNQAVNFSYSSIANQNEGIVAFAIQFGQPKTLSADTGSGSDSVSVTADITASDTGSSSDSVSIAAQIPVTDTGSGLDSISISDSFSLSDTGSGSDSVAITAQIPISDSGSGLDTVALTVQINLTDAGSGLNFIVISEPITISDTGSASDSVVASLGITAADSGSGSDSLAITVSFTAAETGSGSDQVSTSVQLPPPAPHIGYVRLLEGSISLETIGQGEMELESKEGSLEPEAREGQMLLTTREGSMSLTVTEE